MLTRVTLDRNNDVPLFRQLSVSIEMRIIDGELPDGTALPSVRSLATQLQVSPITVVQAYKSLQADGLVRSVPKRGFFVSTKPPSGVNATQLNHVRTMIDSALDAAIDAGIEASEFLRIAGERVSAQAQRRQRVAVFGHQAASLEERVGVVSDYLSDLNVSVDGLSFEEMEAASDDGRDQLKESFDVFLVSVGEVETAATLLWNRSSRIIPMTRVLKADVIDFLKAQPPSARFGIIADSPEYAQRMVAELYRIRELQLPPLVSIVTESEKVRQVLDDAEAILVGALAFMRLEMEIPQGKPWAKFVFLPDNQTLLRLRGKLTWSEPGQR